jgi:hypothetical protein
LLGLVFVDVAPGKPRSAKEKVKAVVVIIAFHANAA